MNCRDIDDQLDQLIDGSLSGEERRQIEEHVMACPACRGQVDELRSLLDRASALPREVPPGRDLWPDIQAALPDRRGTPRELPAARRHAWWTAPRLAAAAALLVVSSVGITALLLREAPTSVPVVPEPGRGAVRASIGVLTELRAAEAEFARATQRLLAALDARRNELSPETLEVVERNLKFINQAIAETRGALERDPVNLHLGQMLTALYHRKVDLLRTVTRTSAPA